MHEPDVRYDDARVWTAASGRFLSPDRVGGRISDPQTWNRYAYALNNPLKFFDPNGLEVTPVEVTFKGGSRQITYVDSRIVGRFVNFNAAVTGKGNRLEFNSVFRTQEQQDRVKTPFTKNTSGTSPHTAGLAFDVNLVRTTESLPGLTKDARDTGFSPLKNQAADPVHFQAGDLITRGSDGRPDEAFKDLVKENQEQAKNYELFRLVSPVDFEKAVVRIESVQNCPQPAGGGGTCNTR